MRYITLSVIAVALISCGKVDVHGACYKNGPHDSMSDGRIISMCDCVDGRVKSMKLGEKQTAWVITLLREKKVEGPLNDTEQKQLRGITMKLSDIKGQCLTEAKAR